MHFIAPILVFLIVMFFVIPLVAGLFIVLDRHFRNKDIVKKWPLPKKVAKAVGVLFVGLLIALALVAYFALQGGSEERKLKKELNKIVLNSSYELKSADCGDVELRMQCVYRYYTSLSPKESSATITQVLKNNGYTLKSNPQSYTNDDISWTATSRDGNIVITYTELSRADKLVYQQQNGNVQFGIYSN